MNTNIVPFWINGISKYYENKNLSTSPVYNPATGEQIKEVLHANIDIINETVEYSHKSFLVWSQTSALKRSRILFKYKELLEKNIDRIAGIITTEHGKIYSDAIGEVRRGIEVVEFACGAPHLLKGENLLNAGTNVDAFSTKHPLGVCLGITPFNFPVMVSMWMFPLSIVCGNSFILKPSEKVPSAAILLGELLSEAGLPKGVFSVLHGGKETVEELIKHDKIKAISFVGSTPIAHNVYTAAALSGKRVQALGGAKNHSIIMEDCNIDSACSGIINATFGASGQRCMATSVAVIVGENSFADNIVSKLAQLTRNLKLGPGVDKNSDLGPLISEQQVSKLRNYIHSTHNSCAELVVDGSKHILCHSSPGFFLGPTLIDKVTPDLDVYKDELFGPVLCVIRVAKIQDALNLVNNNKYGNGASIYTTDGYTARKFSSEITCGMVGVNVAIPVPMAFYSFGGWKDSRFGTNNMHGTAGIDFYTQTKTVSQYWGEKIDLNLTMPVN